MFVYPLTLFQSIGSTLLAALVLAVVGVYVLVQRHRERKRQEAARARQEELRRQREAEVAEEVARVKAKIAVERAERDKVRAERDACLEAGDYKRARLLSEKLARLYR